MFDEVINGYLDSNGGLEIGRKHGEIEKGKESVQNSLKALKGYLRTNHPPKYYVEFNEEITSLTAAFHEEGYKQGFADGLRFVYDVVKE